MTWQEDNIKIHNYFMKDKRWSIDEETSFLALGLCGEAGEVGNLYKKMWRGDYQANFIHDISNELADVMMYLFLLARAEGIDIDEACNNKIEELKIRWPDIWPGGS